MVRTFETHGTKLISYLASYLIWRKVTNYFEIVHQIAGEYPDSDTWLKAKGVSKCPYCDGVKEIDDPQYGNIRCLCQILDWQRNVIDRQQPYQSYIAKVSPINEMNDRNDKTMKSALDIMSSFINDPAHWVLLIGDPGTGKTHMMMAAAHALGPIALYMSAEDFEHFLFNAMDANDVPYFEEVIKTAPILLLDDWGIEYGSPFVAAKLRGIINFRYSLWQEFPTVVSTNLNPTQMKAKDPRLESRLRDKEKSVYVTIKVSDYRKERQ